MNPPSQLNISKNGNHSSMSAISDPSATTVSNASVSDGEHHQQLHYSKPSRFPPVMEETASALALAEDSATAPTDRPEPAGASHNTSGTAALPPSPVAPVLPLECDYDVNPTELYQTIESKKWDNVQKFFDLADSDKLKKQASTWVTRKETNGKLRWRLLPIHAAVIFQSPPSVVEKLLQECPEGAKAKDDQGMLPLHLAFRTKHTCWETVEELITSHTQAIFVQDRKGRSPLQCGLTAASAALASMKAQSEQPTTISNNTSIISALTANEKAKKATSGPTITPSVQKAIFSVLDLYSQIAVQDQVQSCMKNSRQTLEARIGAVQDNHVQTLNQLKKDWESQRNELGRKIQGYKQEIQSLKSDFSIQQELLEEKCKTEMELVDKLQQVTTALEAKTVMDEEVAQDISFMQSNQTKELKEANKKIDRLKKTNKDLLLLLENLLDQQNSLKTSLDKLSWDTNAKNKERQDLLDKYLEIQKETVDMSNGYTEEWQKRLEKTNQEVSAKLSSILSQNAASIHPGIDKYEGEEKKNDTHDTIPHKISSGSLSGSSKKDP